MSGDVESLHGGLSLLDPLVDRILVDTVSQQQGWLRVYGKKNAHTHRGGQGGSEPVLPSGFHGRGQRGAWRLVTVWRAR